MIYVVHIQPAAQESFFRHTFCNQPPKAHCAKAQRAFLSPYKKPLTPTATTVRLRRKKLPQSYVYIMQAPYSRKSTFTSTAGHSADATQPVYAVHGTFCL